ncbi:MAG: hypothetical protein HKO95_14975 [Rhodobacteraceae bacterium]|nr:hypothetical protein [Alphaproteobacteria bacterium]NNF71763.1 hypothetical protein [Paracoccaceae bacterium]NNK68025.1 hypothetical protein [Paracoccaceae bacterium]
MSTWISKPASLLAALALAGCTSGINVGLGLGGLSFTRAAPERISVAGDSVIVAGPPGFCIDRSALKDSQQGAFVLLGSCASISRDAGQPRPDIPGLLTVSVSPLGVVSGPPDELLAGLSEYLQSPQGRATLSRTGDASSVDILETQLDGDMLYIHARDRAGPQPEALEDDYWRALMAVDGRLVTASVVAFSRQPMTREAGLAVLDSFARRLRRENEGPR